MGIGSWISTACDRTFGAAARGISSAASSVYNDPLGSVKSAADSIGNTVSSAASGISSAATAVGNGISYAYQKTGEGINAVIQDPEMILRGGAIALRETGNFIVHTAKDPLRSAALVGQGLTNAATSTVGMVVDAGAFTYNNTIRHAINLGLDEKDMIAKHQLYDKNGNKITYSESFKEHTQWIEPPQNGYEKTLLYGTQAIGEVAAFAAVTAGTAGMGSAAFATARGSAYAVQGAIRGGAYLTRATNFAKQGASFVRHSSMIGRSVKIADTAADLGKTVKNVGGLLKERQVWNATKTMFKGSGKVIADVSVKSGSGITKVFTTAAKGASHVPVIGTTLESALGHGARTASHAWRWSMPLGGGRSYAGMNGRDLMQKAERLDQALQQSLRSGGKGNRYTRIAEESLENVKRSSWYNPKRYINGEQRAISAVIKANKKFAQFEDDIAKTSMESLETVERLRWYRPSRYITKQQRALGAHMKSEKLTERANNLTARAEKAFENGNTNNARSLMAKAEHATAKAERLVTKAERILDPRHLRVTPFTATLETTGGGLSMGMNFAHDAAKAAEKQDQETFDAEMRDMLEADDELETLDQANSSHLRDTFARATGWTVFHARNDSPLGQKFGDKAQASLAQPVDTTFVTLNRAQDSSVQMGHSQHTAA